MRITVIIFLFVAICSCNESKRQGLNKLSNKIIYDKSIDSLESASYLDSLSTQMDCEDSTLNDATYLKEIRDSIKYVYEQIIVRLDSIKRTPQKSQYADQFKVALLQSMKSYDTLNDADQSILYYSYGDATMQGDAAKCYQIFLLRQRLFFLKAVFANAYWNYDFDSFPDKMK